MYYMQSLIDKQYLALKDDMDSLSIFVRDHAEVGFRDWSRWFEFQES